ncbi:MAG: FmdB family zinc ribbon protein [Nitrospiraceae bacterium]
MPIYEYQCQGCGAKSEVKQKMSDAPLTTCERCGGSLSKLISAPGIMFKGSGWYITDYSDKMKPPSGDGSEKSSKGDKTEKSEKSESSTTSASTTTDSGKAASGEKRASTTSAASTSTASSGSSASGSTGSSTTTTKSAS